MTLLFALNQGFMEKMYTLLRGRKLPLILFGVLTMISLKATAQGPGADWQYSRCISLSTPTTMANYQVKLVLTNNEYTNMKSDGSDIRFYDASNNDCPYWIEHWDLNGLSTIWIKVVSNNTTALRMYYGNAAATAVSNGANTFDWFDDFNGTTLDASKWNTITTGGNITVGGGNVTLNNTNNGSVYLYTKNSGFTTASTAYFLESKFRVPNNYHRNRFYATTNSGGNSPLGFDYGYFRNNGNTGNEVFYNGWWDPPNYVAVATDYISQWALTDANVVNNYNWNTLDFSSYTILASRSSQFDTDIRHLTIGVTEKQNTSTVVDWVRVRKRQATEPVLTTGPQQPLVLTASASTICEGTSITFTASTNGFTTFQFYVNNIAYGSPTSINAVTIPNLVNGDKVKVSSIACGNTVTSNEVTITVNPLPTANLTANKTTICAGDVVLFTAATSGNPANTVYEFKIDGTTVQSGTGNTYSTNSITNGQVVTLSVTTPSSCSASSSGIPITVNALPTGTLTSSDADNKICAGASITFTATPGYANYEFFVDGVSQGPASASNSFLTNSLGVGLRSVGVRVTNTSNCYNDFTPVAVTVYALPSGTLDVFENSGTPNNNIICAGANVTFTAPSGNSNYKFYLKGTGAILNANQALNTYTTSSLSNGDFITVVVTNNNGCTNSFNSPAITVNALPSGTLTVSKNPVCDGESVTFTATDGSNFKFYKNGTLVQQGASSTYSYAPVNTDQITVQVTNVNGCVQTYAPLTMVVNPLPTGVLTLTENSGNTANDGIICAGGYVTFTAPSGYQNYEFKVNGVMTQNSSSHVFTTNTLANGNLSIAVTITTSAGCSATLPAIPVTVNPLPTIAPITGTTTFCANETTQLSNTTPGGAWSSSNPAVASISGSGLVTGIAAGNTTITYTVTNSNGCTDSRSMNVTVYAIPAPGAIGGTKSVCSGATQMLTNSLSGGNWTSSNSSIATIASDGTVSGVSAGTVTITYTVTNGNGCTVKVTTPFEVFALPVVNPIIGPAGVCKLSTIDLDDATTGGVWSSGNTGIATVNTSTGVVTGIAPGTVNIFYKVTNGNGCSTTVSKQITVHALPNISLSGPNPICPGNVGVYTTETGMTNYIWTVNGGSITAGGTSSDPNATVTWFNDLSSKSIFVNYTDGNGCSADKQVTVTTSSPDQPVITGINEICQNGTTTYSTATGNSLYTWTWVGGTLVSGGTKNDNTITIQWTTPGNQSVNVNYTNAAGCRATSPTSYNVSVHPLPLASVTTSSAKVCQNSGDVTITFTGSNGTAPYTFKYKIDGGATQSITTVSGNSTTIAISSATVTTHTIQLVDVTDYHGCVQAQSGSVSVQIDPLPNANITGTTAVCAGAAQPGVTFTGSNGTAPYTFIYNINGGANQSVSTISGNSVTVTAPTGIAGTFNYNLISVSDANGCSKNQGGVATITVNPLPQATIALNTTQVCKNGTSPIVTFTGSNGIGPYTFTYKINGGVDQTVTGNPVATINVSTTNAGTFVYSLVSVKDASSTSCTQAQTGSVSVQVDPTSIGGSLSGSATVCYGINSGNINLSGHTGNVIRWEYSTNGGSTWNTINNNSTSLSYSNITQTTLYRAVVQSGVCSFAYSGTVTITVNATSVGGSISGSTTVCSGTNNGTLTLSGYTGSIVRWEYSVNSGSTWTNITNTTANQVYTNQTQTTLYRAYVQNNPCTGIYSANATITVNPLPNATIAGTVAVCQDASSPNITFTGSNATGPYTFTYTINSTTQPTIQGNPSVSVSVPTTMAGTYTYAITKVTAATGCVKNISGASATITINPKPAAIVLTPASATLCQNSTIGLLATSSVVNSGSKTGNNASSGSIPRNSYVNKTINISSIPAGAIITGVDVNFNITHKRTSDLRVFLKAPNGEILKLVNRRGNGENFTNTIVSSNSSNPFTNNGNPFTGTYAADRNSGQIATTTNWGDLFSATNGNWTLSVRDFIDGNSGTLSNWSITIFYQLPATPVNVVWSPSSDLYTDPGTNTVYTGTAISVVYAKPSTAGTKTYTATLTNGFGCSVTNTAALNVNPTPVVTVSADYCSAPGKVRLNATSNPTGTYLWNTGESTQSIDVDIADDYDVTATSPQGCTGSGIISVARELVENGDFEAGNDGSFSSGYLYIPDGAGNSELVADNDNRGYSITTDGNNVHNNFWGFDHTTGSGNFMAINGHDNITIWEQTIDVLPNTNYYFSAWARSLNAAGPFAKLVFTINGIEIGSQLDLTARLNDSDPAHDNWKRFYGNWMSGPSTNSVVLAIKNKEPSHGGNDFAIDDISFASLSTFITLNTTPETQSQEVCINSPVDQIIYSIGNGSPSAPSITGLPDGVSAVWDQDRMLINGTPTTAGNYTYTISTTGSCNPKVMSGAINVTEQKVALSNGLANNTLCINTALPAIIYHLSGKATGAAVTGLPTGVSYSQVGNDVTISGTPSIAGTFNYIITTSGSSCEVDSKTGTIEVTTQSISESSGNKNQSLCVNTPVDNIVFTISGTASNATVSGLPTGLSMTKNGQQYIISGSPAQSGTFNYTVTTSGNCSVTASINGSLSVSPAAVAGTLADLSGSCTGSGTINLSGQLGNVQKWQKSTDNGVTWNDISNTTASENYSGITTPVLYRVFVDNGCGEVISNSISVGRHNYWTGTQSSDWNNTGNWSDNLLPSTSCPDVYIPASAMNQPIISTGSVLVNNIVLENGALLSVVNDAVLQLAGGFTAPGLARVDCSDGTLEMTGSSPQQIPVNLFVNNNVKHLKLSNNAGVTLNGSVDIYSSLTFNSASASLSTNDFLTLKSNKQNTAWIGPLSGGQTITGKVTVERFINIGTQQDEHLKGWQLVAFPTTGQSIKNSLQEGATNGSQNPKPGYGVQLTSAGNWSANGFDASSYAPSMKVYNSGNDNYDGVPNTFIDIHNDHGYFLFVRGDRTVTGVNQPPTNVTLRSKGTLHTGLFTMPVNPMKMESVGNPYASAIDIRRFGFNNLAEQISMWDATDPAATIYSAGKFQALTFDGTNYMATPGGGLFSGPQNFIQSGQAFFVQSNSGTGGSLTINENAKAGGSAILMRPSAPKGQVIKIRSNLYVLQSGVPVLMDGTLSFLDNQYSDEVDEHDARKMMNSGENFGIKVKSTLLIVERRSVPKMTDTIFFNMTNMKRQTYRLEFINENFSRSGLEAWLEDDFTKKRLQLDGDGTTYYEFDVSGVAGSYAPGRFRIVFAPAAAPVPVTFVGLRATRKDAQVQVDWSVQNESNIQSYEVERSQDGIHFERQASVASRNTGVAGYNWLDVNPGSGYQYYRISTVSIDGHVEYSSIVKVLMPVIAPSITVFPNPVQDGVIQLHMMHQPAGKYLLRLTDRAGKLIVQKIIIREEGSSIEKMKWDYKLAHGIYNLEIHKPDGGLHIIKIMY